MVVLIGLLVLLFILGAVLSEGPWGRRRRERWNDAESTGAWITGDVSGGHCSDGGGWFGGGDFGGGGGGDGGGGGC